MRNKGPGLRTLGSPSGGKLSSSDWDIFPSYELANSGVVGGLAFTQETTSSELILVKDVSEGPPIVRKLENRLLMIFHGLCWLWSVIVGCRKGLSEHLELENKRKRE